MESEVSSGSTFAKGSPVLSCLAVMSTVVAKRLMLHPEAARQLLGAPWEKGTLSSERVLPLTVGLLDSPWLFHWRIEQPCVFLPGPKQGIRSGSGGHYQSEPHPASPLPLLPSRPTQNPFSAGSSKTYHSPVCRHTSGCMWTGLLQSR